MRMRHESMVLPGTLGVSKAGQTAFDMKALVRNKLKRSCGWTIRLLQNIKQ